MFVQPVIFPFFSDSDSELFDDDNILWLKEHDAPWTDVLDKWNRSFRVRKLLFNRCTSISAIITDFPALRTEIGHELVNILLTPYLKNFFFL